MSSVHMQTGAAASGNPANHSFHPRLILLCFLLLTIAARAADFNYTTADGKVTITGYTGTGGAVVIPATIDGLPVTRIGDSAFYCHYDVTSIDVPSGVLGIGQFAFSGCGNLTSVTLPSSVTSIGDGTFSSSPKLANVNIPTGVLSLGGDLFADCTALTTISIQSSVTSMGVRSFIRCKGLTSAVILAKVSNIGTNAFDGCTSLTTVTLPTTLTSLPNYLFYGCTSLTNVTIPTGVTGIGTGAFDGCQKLPSITIPTGVTSIGNYAFRNCNSLADLTILGAVQTVGYYAFSGCWKLTAAEFPAGLTSIGQEAFSSCQALASVTLPAGLTRIDSSAFFSCMSLADVTIPASVTSIGSAAFARCTSITKFTVDKANPNYRSLDGVLYDKNVTRLLTYPGARAGGFVVPEGVTAIETSAFSVCLNLTGITFPSSILTIWEAAFSNCPLLEQVIFPPSVTGIGPYAFLNCGKLSGVIFLGNAVSIGSSAFGSAAPGFTVYYQQGSTGFTSPLWMGYPAVALAANQEISVKGPLGELLADGSGVQDFGYSLPGAAVTKIITIANAGSVPLTGISVSIDGPAAAEFAAGNPAATVLAPGTSTTFSVAYTAGTPGLRNAALHVTSNDEDENPFDIPLSGFCTPTPVPEITVFQSANGTIFEDGVSVLNPGIGEVGTFVVTGITIRNSGTGDMHGITISIDGANASDFAFTATPPAALTPGASFSCIVKFSPRSLGTRTAALHIASDDADENPFDITLSGIGKAPPSPEIAVEPASGDVLTDGVSVITFEPVPTGSQSVTQTFTIRNQGNASLQNISLSKIGANAQEFITSTLPKTTLLSGEGMMFTVRFAPSSDGTKVAALYILSNDSDESPFDIQLSGSTPAPTPEIGVQTYEGISMADGESIITFGQTETDESRSRAFMISNSGMAPLANLAITIDGENATDFTVNGPASTTIPAGGLAYFSVDFVPGSSGDRNARLHITSNDSDENPFDIDLSGTGVPPTFPEIAVESPAGVDLTHAVTKVSLGTHYVGTSITKTFTIKNKGTAELIISSVNVDGPDALMFRAIRPAVTELPPGESTAFSIIFIARKAGKVSATIHIDSNDADEIPFDIPISAAVMTPLPDIDILQPAGKSLKDGSASCSFGAVAVKKKASKEFTIRNTGTARLSNLSIKKDGPDATDFIVTPLAANMLEAGDTMNFKVTFKPRDKGVRKAVIHIKSNDADESPFDIEFTGKGTAPASARESLAEMVSISSAADGLKQDGSISRMKIGGKTYRTITLRKRSGEEIDEYAVEVSSNLIDWFAGPRHTTVVIDDASQLIVRDNTPVSPETKRYIRLKSPPTGRVPRRGARTP